MTAVTVYHVRGKRPDRASPTVPIPAGWHIFNAPRPLYASPVKFEGGGEIYPEWRGDFIHGVFYAAVDPADAGAIKRNAELDGYVLEWHDDAEIRAWAEGYAKEIEVDLSEFTEREIVASFFQNKNWRGGETREI